MTNNEALEHIKAAELREAAQELFDNSLGWSDGRNPYAPREIWAELGEALYGPDDPRVIELKEGPGHGVGSSLRLKAENAELREEIRLKDEALRNINLWIPASIKEMTAEQLVIWLLVERALRGEAEIPDSVPQKEQAMELYELVHREDKG